MDCPDVGAGIFETLLVLGGRPVALRPHLQRLASSADALYGAKLDVARGSAIECSVRSTVTDLTGSHRLRILATPVRVGQAGQLGAAAPAGQAGGAGQVSVELETEPAPLAFEGRPVAPITLVPTVIEGGLGPHKLRDRSMIERRRAELGLAESSHLLIVDSDGTVLETERGNVVAFLGNRLVSPPPDGRLLKGVTVGLVFAIAEQLGLPAAFVPLTLGDIERADEVFCTSAVRGLTPAGLAGRRPRAGGTIAGRLGTALFESWRST